MSKKESVLFQIGDVVSHKSGHRQMVVIDYGTPTDDKTVGAVDNHKLICRYYQPTLDTYTTFEFKSFELNFIES